MKKILKPLILLSFVPYLSLAESFKVNDVRVKGLQRITAGSFFNYIPVKRGQILDDRSYPEIINNLYQTGFFDDVSLSRDGNTLVVNVKERPVIGEINIEGNKEIKKKQLLEGLKTNGLGEGDTFDSVRLNAIRKELLRLYHSRSKFDVIIETKSRPLGEGRVALDINIQEGVSARIAKINIVGNRAFSEEKILSKTKLTTPKWHSLFTKTDRYSGDKLAADIQTIESFYHDRGYLDFRVDSVQVSLTDDKKAVYITINVSEGLPYRVDGSTFSANEVLNNSQLNDLLTYNVGEYYSRAKVTDSQKRIRNALGEKGFAFANVTVSPKKDIKNHTAVMVYSIVPGKKTYVRRIEFTGNYKTNDEVLRREMRQMESAVYNHEKLARSDVRIQRLRHIASVERRERPVPGKPDQSDIVYKVKETPARSITAGVGYGSSSGVMFNLGYETVNFLGTGNSFQLDFSKSSSEKNYAMSFTDPYYTVDGVSRTYSVYYNSTDESKADIGDWATDNLGAFVNYGFPIDEYESFSLGGGYRRTEVKTGDSVSPEIPAWLDKHGTKFDEFILNTGWTHDTRDKAIFSTKGSVTRLGAEVAVPGSDETYYKLNARNRSYFPLNDKLIVSLRGDLSYGDGYGSTDGLPFFRNYYAGGLSTVRGYSANSLGPRWKNKDVKGGTLRVTGGAELILPWTFGQEVEKVRLGLFTDFGNVYNDVKDFDAGKFRYSAGAYLLWRSPIGPLNMSYGVPLNHKKGDDIERFQFTLGVPF